MNIILELEGARSIGITGHVRPDGDCVGSVMGLYNYLKANMPDKAVDVYLEQPGKEFEYIPGFDVICNEPKPDKIYDAFIVLDCSDTERITPFITCFQNAKKTICVDHHISNNDYADVNLVRPDASSTCEVLYTALDEDKINADVAQCLYTGIIHDTGVFKYSATSKATMTIAGKLMEMGIPYSDIIDNSFYKKTFAQNKILGKALLNAQLLYGGKCIYSVINQKEMEEYGVNAKELGGVIEQLRLTEGVEVAVFLYQTAENEYKVSLRSKKYVNVSSISVEFGGGGHVRAAGFSIEGKPQDIIQRLGIYLEKQFDTHKA